MTPKHILGCIAALSENKNTWEMDHLWCTYDDWTLSLVTGQVWTVTKIADGILLFVKNRQPPKHLLDASTIPITQQQNNLEDGSFFMHFQSIIFVPFQTNFWKVIKWVTGISTIDKANGSQNAYQYQWVENVAHEMYIILVFLSF